MDSHQITKLLESVRDDKISIEEALTQLKKLPFEDLGYAQLDHHRTLRHGFPEVIWTEGKELSQIVGILERLLDGENSVMATRVKPDLAESLLKNFPSGKYLETARLFVIEKPRPCGDKPIFKTKGPVLILSAGTSDIPVAEEAYWTAHTLGNEVQKIYDVGVAGIHRLLANTEVIQKAAVIIVIAGMEGALPSVVAGIAGKPVIGVPTSVGYGVSLKGLTPLFAMLTSCASGVTVVNIDNGFGAAYAATLMNRI